MIKNIQVFFVICLLFCKYATSQNKASISEMKIAIENGYKWLDNNKMEMTTESYLVYNYLVRANNVPNLMDHTHFKRQLTTGEFKTMKPFLRLMEENVSITKVELDSVSSKIDRLVTKALWCDVYELPNDYLESIEKLSSLGKHKLTHAFLAVIFAKENNCESILPLYNSLLSRIKEYIQVSPINDTWIQAVALLLYAEEDPQISAEEIAKILSYQSDNGGWNNYPNSKSQNHHTTVLALMALQEFINKDAIKKDKWIRK